jgi:DNA invertase Pin-like site-specific DNA recombinase
MRAAIYIRVSTASKSRQGDSAAFDQNPAVQEQPLRDLIQRRGWELAKVYEDRATTPALTCEVGLVHQGLSWLSPTGV